MSQVEFELPSAAFSGGRNGWIIPEQLEHDIAQIPKATVRLEIQNGDAEIEWKQFTARRGWFGIFVAENHSVVEREGGGVE